MVVLLNILIILEFRRKHKEIWDRNSWRDYKERRRTWKRI